MTDKKTKKDISGDAEFFLVALPGLEDVVQAELSDYFPELKSTVEHGGVTVMAPLSLGLSLNLVLKTPTRVLLRITNFRCRDFPRLFQEVSKFDWKRWIDPDCELKVHVSTRLSRLKIKRRIEETCEDGWVEYKRRTKATSVRGRTASLYVRFLNDQCTLSLDTSGERLHKRGTRQHIGDAPLRETIAASLIQLVARLHPGEGDAGVEIVDPMMGSGTFLLEAGMRDMAVASRDFAFHAFNVSEVVKAPTLKVARPRIEKLTGFEVDKKALEAAKVNLKNMDGPLHAEVHAIDFFRAEPLPPSDGRRRWVFANPPYGERIKVKEPLLDLYVRLFEACEKTAHPDRACFLLPAKAVKGKFALPMGWKVLEKRPFLNGGIPVIAFIFGRTK